jgi:hypothetical protein
MRKNRNESMYALIDSIMRNSNDTKGFVDRIEQVNDAVRDYHIGAESWNISKADTGTPRFSFSQRKNRAGTVSKTGQDR